MLTPTTIEGGHLLTNKLKIDFNRLSRWTFESRILGTKIWKKTFQILKQCIPMQQSLHILRSIFGMSLHEIYSSLELTMRNTSRCTRVMSSLLSHITRAREVCLIWRSWSGLKTIEFSYQNLEINMPWNEFHPYMDKTHRAIVKLTIKSEWSLIGLSENDTFLIIKGFQ